MRAPGQPALPPPRQCSPAPSSEASRLGCSSRWCSPGLLDRWTRPGWRRIGVTPMLPTGSGGSWPSCGPNVPGRVRHGGGGTWVQLVRASRGKHPPSCVVNAYAPSYGVGRRFESCSGRCTGGSFLPLWGGGEFPSGFASSRTKFQRSRNRPQRDHLRHLLLQ
jgi:hypothetical protein